MKAVMISINPKWCEKIASGEKTIEVRKTSPKIDTPFKCYIYCNKDKRNEDVLLVFKGGKRVEFGDYRNAFTYDVNDNVDWHIGNGKVIGEFLCDWITKITPNCDIDGCVNQYTHGYPAILGDNDCLSFNDMEAYLGNKKGYDWHISDLKIYDKPKELGEFFTPFCKRPSYMLERPFQSWGYVEEKEKDNGQRRND